MESLRLWFSWPALPFSILLCLVMFYWLLVIVMGVGDEFLHFLHLDFDVHADLSPDMHGSLTDWGMVGLKWFNLGDVPLMIWLTALALSSWLITTLVDRNLADPSSGTLAVIVVRNLGLGLIAAKILTQPIKGKFKYEEPNTLDALIGRRCVVTTIELTDHFGQIECADPAGAPLKLNACTDGEAIVKGTEVEIVGYSKERRQYFVKPV